MLAIGIVKINKGIHFHFLNFYSDYRVVQQQTSILAPEIMAAFVNSQIFNENYSNQKTSTPSTTVHKKHLSEGFKDSKGKQM